MDQPSQVTRRGFIQLSSGALVASSINSPKDRVAGLTTTDSDPVSSLGRGIAPTLAVPSRPALSEAYSKGSMAAPL
jgi:hypothetical protein